jgi:hypothetical protein
MYPSTAYDGVPVPQRAAAIRREHLCCPVEAEPARLCDSRVQRNFFGFVAIHHKEAELYAMDGGPGRFAHAFS